MTDYVFLILLILHIGSIVGWLGAVFLFGSVLGPSISSLTPQGKTEFSLNVIPRFMRYVLATSGASLVFGVLLYAYSVVIHPSLGPSTSGTPLVQAGAGLGLIAFIIIVFVGRLGSRLVNLERTQPSNPESLRMQKRMRMGTGLVSGLLVIVLILMIAGSVV